MDDINEKIEDTVDHPTNILEGGDILPEILQDDGPIEQPPEEIVPSIIDRHCDFRIGIDGGMSRGKYIPNSTRDYR